MYENALVMMEVMIARLRLGHPENDIKSHFKGKGISESSVDSAFSLVSVVLASLRKGFLPGDIEKLLISYGCDIELVGHIINKLCPKDSAYRHPFAKITSSEGVLVEMFAFIAERMHPGFKIENIVEKIGLDKKTLEFVMGIYSLVTSQIIKKASRNDVLLSLTNFGIQLDAANSIVDHLYTTRCITILTTTYLHTSQVQVYWPWDDNVIENDRFFLSDFHSINESQNRPVNILITGLLRTPDVFKTSLEYFLRCQSEGVVDKIVISTWHSEKDKFFEFAKSHSLNNYTKTSSIMLLCGNEPAYVPVGLRGNLYHVCLAIERGLEVFSEDEFIFKTRTDIHVSEGFLDRLFASVNGPSFDGNTGNMSVFNSKVWVPSLLSAAMPFFLNAAMCLGKARDIALLLNYDNYLYVHTSYSTAVLSHINFRYNPFKDRLWMFNYYFKTFEDILWNRMLFDNFVKIAQTEKVFIKLMVIYWKVVIDNYLVDSKLQDKEDIFQKYFYYSLYFPYEHDQEDISKLLNKQEIKIFSLLYRTDRPFRDLFLQPLNDSIPELFQEVIGEVCRGDLGDKRWWKNELIKLLEHYRRVSGSFPP